MRAWKDVATLTKARNSNGRFAAKAAVGLPFLLEPGDEVAFVPPVLDAPRTGVVVSVRLSGDGQTAEIAFDGIGEPGVMQSLVGCHCLLPRELIDESALIAAPGLWEGFALVDVSRGLVGHVAGVIDNPAHMLLEVARNDNDPENENGPENEEGEESAGTFLVPAVDDIVLSVDSARATISVDLPNGLIDL